MDFVRYAERAAWLVNHTVTDAAQLRHALSDRPAVADRVTGRDVGTLRALQPRLREVFEHSARQDGQAVVRCLNTLLAEHPVSPFISGHDEQSWHLHVAEVESSVSQTLAAEALMGLAVVVCDYGTDRFGGCQAAPCTNVFVDISPNRSRRYCSERCSARANVAAFRARRKAGGAV